MLPRPEIETQYNMSSALQRIATATIGVAPCCYLSSKVRPVSAFFTLNYPSKRGEFRLFFTLYFYKFMQH